MFTQTPSTPDDLELNPTRRNPVTPDEGNGDVSNHATPDILDVSRPADTSDAIEGVALRPNATHGSSKPTADQAPAEAPKSQVGLLVNDELEQALKECQEKVKRIAKECRTRNTKFR